MTISDFNKIVDNQCNYIKSSLVKKQTEYNYTEDRLDSFKTAAMLEAISPVRVLEGYLTKHIVSLYDMMNSEKKYKQEQWQEKIGDAINYFILLEALLKDTNMYSEETK